MDNQSTLANALFTLSNILSLALAVGMIFALLVQPRRERTTILFAVFCASIALWAIFSLAKVIPDLVFGLPAESILPLLTTAACLTAGTFFLFVVRFTRSDAQLTTILFVITPIFIVAGMIVVWSEHAFAFDQTTAGFERTPIGYVVLIGLVAYGVLALWIILSSRSPQVALLRVPALLLTLAFASDGISTLHTVPVNVLLATVAAVWVGYIMLNLQLFNPINELTDELRTANRDLRQALNDLTKERARIDQLTRDLQTAGGFKSEFLTSMSHKLRTPLNSIAGYSELLQSGIYGELNEKQLDRLQKIHRNSAVLLDLINNMLDLSKIEAGRLELNQSLLRIGAIIEPVVTQLDPQRAEKGLALEVDLENGLLPVSGDEKRIQQVVSQLVSNAIKFTSQGQISVRAVNTHVQNGMSSTFKLPVIGWLSDGDWVIISISDTGIGIAPEDQARIFDEFYQVGEQGIGDTGGTGLGLAITKKLVELHNGVIWVKSVPNQGSTFFVALPSYPEAKTA